MEQLKVTSLCSLMTTCRTVGLNLSCLTELPGGSSLVLQWGRWLSRLRWECQECADRYSLTPPFPSASSARGHLGFVTTTSRFGRPHSKTTPLLPRIIKGSSLPFPKIWSQDSVQAAPPKKSFLKQTGAAQAKENTQPCFFGQGRGRSYSWCITPPGLEYKRIPG